MDNLALLDLVAKLVPLEVLDPPDPEANPDYPDRLGSPDRGETSGHLDPQVSFSFKSLNLKTFYP